MNLELLLASAERHLEYIDPDALHKAAEAAHDTHKVAHEMGLLDYIFNSNVINFLIVVWILVYLFKKFDILGAIPKQQQFIIDKIEHSEKIKQEAQDEYNETEEKFKNVDAESKEIVENGKSISVSLVEQIEKETEQQKEVLSEKTDKLIEAQKQQAANEITNEISRAAIYVAKEHIKKSVNEDMHDKFINEFIDNLDNVKVKK